MADLRISELTSANLPLSGAEETPIVQGGVTKKTTVNDILSGFNAALNLKEDKANKGVANGYAPLNSSVKIDSTYLPSYVDDVVEVADFASLPLTGETGKIYVTIDNNKIYRWSGTVYVEISENVIPDLQAVLDIGNTANTQIEIDTTAFSGADALVGINFNPIAGNGVIGYSNVGSGVRGESNSGVGVYGQSETGVAGFFLKNDIGVFDDIIVGNYQGTDVFKVKYTGDVNANSFIKSGGTSSQFLKADGSVDSSTYLTGTSGWSLIGNSGTDPATHFIGTTDTQDLRIRTNNVERVFISQTGRIGINQTYLGQSFILNLATDQWDGIRVQKSTSDSLPPSITFSKSRGNLTTPLAVNSNDRLGSIFVNGHNGTSFGSNCATITIFASEAFTPTAQGTYMTFETTTIGSTTRTERMRLLDNGRFGIGTNAPTKTLDINGELRIRTLPTGLSTENILVVNGSGDVRSVESVTSSRVLGYTVATLPAGTIGMVAYVTDATAPTYLGTLTGGGSVVCPVFHNGTAWVSH